jgi:signal peptidase II
MLPQRWRGRPVTIAAAVFLGLIVVALLFGSGFRSGTTAGLALFCAGSLGNLYDRVFAGGNVVDFLSFHWGWLRTDIFNLADVAVVVGAALFLLNAAAGILRWAANGLGLGR